MEYLCDVHNVLSLDLPLSEVDRWMERWMCRQVGKARDIDRLRGKKEYNLVPLLWKQTCRIY